MVGWRIGREVRQGLEDLAKSGKEREEALRFEGGEKVEGKGRKVRRKMTR